MKKLLFFKIDFSSKIFLSILKSMLIIIPLPIIILIIMEMVSLNIIEDTISNFENIIFEKVSDEIEFTYEDAYQTIYNIKVDEDINKYLRSKERNYYTEYEIFKSFNKIIKRNKNIDEIALYLHSYDYVLSTNSGMSTYDYKKKYYKNFDGEQEKYKISNLYMSSIHFYRNSEGNNILITDIGDNNKLIIKLKDIYILEKLNNIFINKNDNVYIILNNKMLVSTNSNKDDDLAKELTKCYNENKDKLKIKDLNYHLKFREITKKGIILVYAKPENIQYLSVKFSKALGISCIILCIILLFIAVLLTTNRNYAPIKRLFDMLKDDGDYFQELNYGNLEKYIKSYKEQNKNMKIKLKKYEDDIKELYLGKLLISGLSHSISKEDIKLWGFYGKFYTVTMFLFENQEKEQDLIGDYKKEILKAYIEQYLKDYIYYMIENKSNIYFIINGNGNTEDEFYKDVKNKNFQLLDEFIKVENIYCSTYISKCFKTLDDVHKGYCQVNNMRKKEIILEDEKHQEDVCSIKKILNIIEENLSDINLSVSSLAELLNITPSYLSRFFKKEMGKGVLEFIHESRIIKAKEMMEADINIKAKEVSEIVGFSNIATFIRVFKKIEGITPGQFKETLCKK